MHPRRDGIGAANLEFYEQAYSLKSLPGLLLKQWLSYDQLSKTRRNLRMIARLPKPAAKLSVLDYGFGHGTLLMRLPRSHRISGCELSPQAIRNLEFLSRFLRRRPRLYSAEELEAASGSLSLDLICCSHVIEHVKDDSALLGLFHRNLCHDGYLLLNIPINEVWHDPMHVRAYTLDSTRTALREAGFTIQEMVEADRWTAWLLHHERVSSVRFRPLFRPIRLLLALMPVSTWDMLERFIPEQYAFQQLLVLAKKT
jgi:SAM-dependent methyltransferase